MRRLRAGIALTAGLLLATTLPARADEPTDKDAAISLFDQAQELMGKGEFAAACPKLVESQRLSPALGTLLNLARCREGEGKIASAWSGYREVSVFAEKAGQTKRAKTAQDLAAALEPKLSRMRIEVQSPPEGFAIRRDGAPIEGALLGTAVVVDPGEHVIEATAPGFVAWSMKITVGKEADLQVVTVPPLTPEPQKPAPPIEPTPTVTAQTTGAPLATVTLPPPPPAPDTRRTAGLAMGGVGLGLLAIGGIFGGIATAEVSRIQNDPSLCPNKACSDPGYSALQVAVAEAWVSTVGLGLGAALFGAGAILVATSKGHDAKAPSPAKTGSVASMRVGLSPSPSGAGVWVSGGF